MKNTLHHHFASYFKDEVLEPYIYALSKRMENGHICIPIDASIESEFDEGGFTKEQSKLLESALLASDEKAKKPFVYYKDKFYLQRYFQYETNILNCLKKIATNNSNLEDRKKALKLQKDFILNQISPTEDITNYSIDEKPDWQAVAAIQGVLNNLTIITGGPGTGKTTTVAKIVALLKKIEFSKLRIALAAPTGKAAVRMKESLLGSIEKYKDLDIEDVVNSSEPKTLHRLLGTKLNSPFFKHNASNPLPYDVVIVDESSMISVAMFSKLVEAIDENTRLIILGDSEQLASVDAGSLFGDICLSQTATENKFLSADLEFINHLIQPERELTSVLEEKNNFLNHYLVRLRKTYRFDQDSKMGKFTQAVIKGKSDRLKEIIALPDDQRLSIDKEYKTSFFESFVRKYKSYIEEGNIEKALDKLNDCRVLCAIRHSDDGVYAINEKIQNFLKKEYIEKKELFNPNAELYHNQIIMVTKNQPDLYLFNGDVGIVRRSLDNKLKVFFPTAKHLESGENYLEVNPGFIEQWETVFAMTIHKSQGSEFNEVLVILPKNEGNRLLTRELLYTGVTRAKNQAHIQGTFEVLKTTTDRFVHRVSGIKERIQSNN